MGGIVACQAGNIFACRSNRRSVLQLGLASNPLVFIGIGYELTLLLLVYAPPLMSAFRTGPSTGRHWLLLSVFGPLVLFLEEIRKAVRARFSD